MKITLIFLLTYFSFSNVFSQSGSMNPDGIFIPRVNSLAACGSPLIGQIVYLNTENKLYYCNGTTWNTSIPFSLPFSQTLSSASGLMNITNSNSGNSASALQTTIDNPSSNANTFISYTAGSGSAAYLYTSNNSAHALKTNGKLNFSGINEEEGKVLTSDANGNASWKYGSQVAFSVTSNHPTYTEQDTYLKINYTFQNYDLGGNITLSSDTFIAPYNGIYHFDAALKAEAGIILEWPGIYYGLSLWKNDIKIAETFSDIEVNVSAVLSKDVKLNAQDEIQMKVFWHDGSGLDALYLTVYENHTNNYFNGHLVTRLP
jgi:hypothetical protein